MKNIKHLTIKVTYRVGLGNVEVPDEVYNELAKAYDEGGDVPEWDDELIKLLLPDMEQEIKNAYSLQHRAMEQRKECWNLVKEIRELFYECSDEEYCIRKSLDEIEEKKVVEVLEKYHKLLGFV